MKHLLLTLTLLTLGFSAQANDRKIGNVVAVEREVSNIYASCLKNNENVDKTKPQSFFTCAIKFIKAGEIGMTSGRVLTLIDDQCTVVGESVNGALLVTFAGAKSPSTFETASACLEKSLSGSDSIKALVFTVQ